MHDFGKPWWGVAYVPYMTNLRALYAWVHRWHVTCMLSLAEHWQGRRALSNHVCAHSLISVWHVVCLQHLARACSEQSRLTSVLPINHVIQMPQCISGFVNHDCCRICNVNMPAVLTHNVCSWWIGRNTVSLHRNRTTCVICYFEYDYWLITRMDLFILLNFVFIVSSWCYR